MRMTERESGVARSREPDSDVTLVLTTWSPPSVGGPQNLYNLFSQFPEDSYIILTSAHGIDRRSGATGTWLPGRYVFYDNRQGWVAGKARAVDAGEAAPFRQRTAGILARLPVIGPPLVGILGLLKATTGFTTAALRIIRSSRIRRLLGMSDFGASLIGTYLANRLAGVPYALYFFDLYRGNALPWAYRRLADHFEPRLLKNASAVIVTNEETERHLRRRYGESLACEVVPNSAFPDAYESCRTPFDPSPPYTIVFTGNVYWAQEGALMNLVRAMERLADLPVRLDLYVPEVPESIRKAIAGRPNIRMDYARPADMPRIQCGATLLFLPLAWDTMWPDIVATATPGKFTDYLASGRPMLVHAPEYAYVARYSREHGTGIVVDRNDVGELAAAVRRALEDPATGRRCVENALRVFAGRHDARVNARRLREILGRIGVEGSRP